MTRGKGTALHKRELPAGSGRTLRLFKPGKRSPRVQAKSFATAGARTWGTDIDHRANAASVKENHMFRKTLDRLRSLRLLRWHAFDLYCCDPSCCDPSCCDPSCCDPSCCDPHRVDPDRQDSYRGEYSLGDYSNGNYSSFEFSRSDFHFHVPHAAAQTARILLDRKNEGGASLLELMIALSLFGALLIFGIPVARELLHAGALKRESENLIQELESLASVSADLRTPIFASFEHTHFTFTTAEQTIIRVVALSSSLSAAFRFGVVPGEQSGSSAGTVPKSLVVDAEKLFALYPTGTATAGTITLGDSTGKTCVITQSARGRRTLECA